MTDLRKAAEMALEVMEYNRANGTPNMGAAIEALRQALAQPEQDYERGFVDGMQKQMQSTVEKAVNAMTKRKWVGLTDEEVESWRGNYDFFDSTLVREVEAKLKEKNGVL